MESRNLNPNNYEKTKQDIEKEKKEYGIAFSRIETFFNENPEFSIDLKLPLWFQKRIVPIYLNDESNFKQKIKILNNLSKTNNELTKEIIRLRNDNNRYKQENQNLYSKIENISLELESLKSDNDTSQNVLESSFDRFIAPSLIEKLLFENDVLKRQVEILSKLLIENTSL